MISNAVFQNLGNVANGGSIYSSGRDLSILCCMFISNTATSQGGSIYFENGVLSVSKSSFYECYSSAYTNAVYGNAILVIKKEATLNDLSTCLCGMSSKQCSDSSISIAYAKSVTKCLNATSNHGLIGASLIQNWEDLDGTMVSYSQNINGKDDYDIVSIRNWYPVEKCNFINSSYCKNVAYQDANNIISFISCFFWNINSLYLSCSGYSLIIINCMTNSKTIPSIDLVTEYLPNIIILQWRGCNYAVKSMYRRSIYTFNRILSCVIELLLVSK